MAAAEETRLDSRTRIVEAAARLLRESGPAAVTTRRVAEAAGLQAPAIYRLFGDKDGLLEAVAEHVLATWVAAKAVTAERAASADVDPVEELRSGWRAQIAFGLEHPGLFRLLSDPARAEHSAAMRSGLQVLRARVDRLARAGLLRVDEERAVRMVQAAGTGAVLTLLTTPPAQRDDRLADGLLDAVLAQICVTAPEPAQHAPLVAAVTVRAVAGQWEVLSPAERALLCEWLDRVIASAR